MKFSDHLWQAIAPIYQQIIDHPFNRELAEGTLNNELFIFFIEQDVYYLVSYARALALIAARTDTSAEILLFLNLSLGALVSERELHVDFLPLNYDGNNFNPSPACLAYSQHLIASAATAPIEEAIAAVLPCLWIYREVGRHIVQHARKDNPFIKWINMYASMEFSDETDQAIAILDKLACNCPPILLDRMKKAFEYSAQFEWHFWDDAYRMTTFLKTAPEVVPVLY